MEAAPLVWGLDRPPWSEQVALERAPDEQLVEALAAEELDLALAPSAALLAAPERYEVVPGMSLCSAGRAGTLRLVHRGALAEVDHVVTRAPAHTASLVLRVLFASSGRSVTVEGSTRSLARLLADEGAVLLTGDDAVFEQTPHGARSLDLGEAWTSLTRLPLVRSLWLARPGRVLREHYALLHTARTRGKEAFPATVRRVAEARGERDADRLAATLRELVVHRLGNPQMAGLFELARAAHEALGYPEPRRPRMIPLSAGSACHAKAEALGVARRHSRGWRG